MHSVYIGFTIVILGFRIGIFFLGGAVSGTPPPLSGSSKLENLT